MTDTATSTPTNAEGVNYDVVVIGGGPAGLSAAGWLGRYRRRTLVVDSGEYRNRWVDEVHGYFAGDPTEPAELRARGRGDLEQYPHVEVLSGRVNAARRCDDGTFEVNVDSRAVRARRLVLATGVRDVVPDVARFYEFYGRDVFHCPTCDGYQARGRCVAVFGGKPYVAAFAIELLDWADEIHIVTNGQPLDIDDAQRRSLASAGIEVIEDRVVELIGRRGSSEGVRLATGDRTECSMAFFSIEHRPSVELAEQLGCLLDDDGYVVVDHEARTTVTGVYAAGDLTAGMQLVSVAVAKGTVAGVACAMSLHGEPPLRATPTPAPEPGALTGPGDA